MTTNNGEFALPTIVVLADVAAPTGANATAAAPTSQQWAPRQSERRRIFALSGLEFQQQFVQFSTTVAATGYMTGFPERDYFHFLNNELRQRGADPGANVTFLTWGTDQGTPWRRPMYAQGPYFMVQDPTLNEFYGVFAANSHAANLFIQRVDTSPRGGASDFRVNMTFAGGILDLFIIRGRDHLDVVQQYHAIIGKPAAPPMWALTHHQCRWGYHTLDILKTVVDRYRAADIPLGCIFNDNDPNFPSEELWTVNTDNYPLKEYEAYVRRLRDELDIAYVQIIDPAIKLNTSYWVYQRAMEHERRTGKTVFVRRDAASGNAPATNTQWVGWAAFVDFTDRAAAAWWNGLFNEYRMQIPVSGSWLDMSEVSPFPAGLWWYSLCNVSTDTKWDVNMFQNTNWTHLQDLLARYCANPVNRWNFPPRSVMNNGANLADLDTNWTLFAKTLSMSAETHAGRYYSTKSFYGHAQARTMNQYYKSADGRRPFLLTRASFWGTGKYAQHWLGDNNAAWHQGGLRSAVGGALLMSQAGFSVVGPDTGGFAGHPSGELLTRFYSTTCFMTYLRNHNSGPYSSDEWPGGQEIWQYDAAVQKSCREAIRMRYRLLPYISTLLFRVNFDGGVVVRHLSAEFPLEAATYVETTTFMTGPSILVVPVTDEGVSSTLAYLPSPSTLWYDLWFEQRAQQPSAGSYPAALRGGASYVLSAKLYDEPIPAFLRAGSILPMHTSAELTLSATRNSGISLLVALDEVGAAAGEGWFDDGADMLFADPDAMPFASSDNATALRKVSYRAFAPSPNTHFVFEATTVLAGPLPAKLPLARPATLTVLFPPAAGIAQLPQRVLLDSVDVTNRSQMVRITDWALRMTVPDTTLDGTALRSFRIEWLWGAPAPHTTNISSATRTPWLRAPS